MVPNLPYDNFNFNLKLSGHELSLGSQIVCSVHKIFLIPCFFSGLKFHLPMPELSELCGNCKKRLF